MGFTVWRSLARVAWVSPGSSPAGLGSEWHLTVSTSRQLSEGRAESAKETTAEAGGWLSAPGQVSQLQPLQRAVSQTAWSKLARNIPVTFFGPKAGPSLCKMSWEVNAGWACQALRVWPWAVALAHPPRSQRVPEPTSHLCLSASSLWPVGPHKAVPEHVPLMETTQTW